MAKTAGQASQLQQMQPIQGTHEIVPSVHVRAPWRPAAVANDSGEDGASGDVQLAAEDEDGPVQAVLFSSGVAAAADESEQPFGGLSFASAIAGGGGSSDGSSRHHSSASLHAQGLHAGSV